MANKGKQGYTESDIRSLDWKEHIRLRPGMYIGKLGDGASADDGIYVVLKEVIDNSIDEHLMGHGKTIEISIKEGAVQVRDYGRGIPHGAVVDCVSKINTGAKYSEGAFSKTVGLNGVGTKAVNALSTECRIESFRFRWNYLIVEISTRILESRIYQPIKIWFIHRIYINFSNFWNIIWMQFFNFIFESFFIFLCSFKNCQIF